MVSIRVENLRQRYEIEIGRGNYGRRFEVAMTIGRTELRRIQKKRTINYRGFLTREKDDVAPWFPIKRKIRLTIFQILPVPVKIVPL